MTEELQIITVDGGTHVVSVGVQGPPGATGAAGATGATGPGVASGGSTGQYLKKASGTDYDTTWDTVSVSPGGSTRQLQYNASGVFGGATGLEYQSGNLVIGSSANTYSLGTARLDVTGETGRLSFGFTSAEDVSNAAMFALRNSTNNKEWFFVQKSSTNPVYTANSFVFNHYDGSSFSNNAFIFTPDFRLGIGTAYAPAAQLDVRCTSASNIGLIVKGAASQTANLQQWQNSSGTALASISSAGYLSMPGITFYDAGQGAGAGLGITSGGHAAMSVPAGYGFYLTGNYGFYPNYNSANFGITINNALTAASAPKTTPAVIPLRIIANASQTANLQEWQNSTATTLSAIDKNGAWVPPSMADGSAANNTVYYSTTASKLVYKDSGGTVNNLY